MEMSRSVASGFAEGAALSNYGGQVPHHWQNILLGLIEWTWAVQLQAASQKEQRLSAPLWQKVFLGWSPEALLHQPLLHPGAVADLATIAITFCGVMVEHPEFNVYQYNIYIYIYIYLVNKRYVSVVVTFSFGACVFLHCLCILLLLFRFFCFCWCVYNDFITQSKNCVYGQHFVILRFVVFFLTLFSVVYRALTTLVFEFPGHHKQF